MGLFGAIGHLIAPATKALGLTGGGGGGGGPQGPTMEQMSQDYAGQLTDPTGNEKAYLDKAGAELPGLRDATDQSLNRYTQEGNNLGTLDQDAFNRSYQPAFARLMHDYNITDTNLMNNMNDRGIASVGTSAPDLRGDSNVVGVSTPEEYARQNLAYDTKTQMDNAMQEAQNNAMNQQIQRFQAQAAVPQLNMQNEANVTGNLVTPATDRMQTKAQTATSMYGSKLGNQTAQNEINAKRKMASNALPFNVLGGVLGAGGMAMASDPDLKENIKAPDPDAPAKDLDEVRGMGLKRWNYKGDSTPRQGPMVNEVPEDIQTPDGHGIDVQGMVGKLIGAVQALDQKVDRQYGNGLRSVAAR